MENNLTSLENYLQEETIIQFLGISTSKLRDLRRNDGLPFIQIAQGKRLYREQTFIEWLDRKEKVLNKDENDLDMSTDEMSGELE